ncbi:hypothetical protein Lbuc_1450 [Lentilactobacillus buchneri NRRL B-30929]|nr:hypothetical protein Lbuc_1450 [Lentilactobacillus buchneri NRRL B-30929]
MTHTEKIEVVKEVLGLQNYSTYMILWLPKMFIRKWNG